MDNNKVEFMTDIASTNGPQSRKQRSMNRCSQNWPLVIIALLPLSMGAQSRQEPVNNNVVAKAPSLAGPTFNPSLPLASRITTPPEVVLQRYRGGDGPKRTLHELNDADRAKVVQVLQQLPPFAKQALTEHVRSVSFVDGIVGNGTTIKEEDSTLSVFNIVLRASLLNENVSDFLTRNERNCYTASDSDVSVSVEAGSLPALLYVFLHESVHVIDISNRLGQVGPPQLFSTSSPFQLVQGIWDDATKQVPSYQSPQFENSWFRTGKPVSISTAETIYQMLARSPFVSLYGSSNWYDDAAELVTCYYLTQKLHQPYRIVLHKGSEVLYSLDPMSSGLVTARFAGITPLFS